MRDFTNKIKKAPRWAWPLGFLCIGLQYGLYRLADLLARVTGTIGRAFAPKIPAVDDLIPVVAAFIVIYVFSYIFWVCGPIAVSLTKRRNFVNYSVGRLLACRVGFLFCVLMPTCRDRAAEVLLDDVRSLAERVSAPDTGRSDA